MNYTDLAPSYIRAIAPYQPGKPIAELERELGITGIVKLASNENPLGASPKAIEAMYEAIKTIALYPDGNGFELKDALVKRYGVALNNIGPCLCCVCAGYSGRGCERRDGSGQRVWSRS
jgi:histidinol-phosphate aminotransferase